ncbi:MAG TPA: PEP-CTERM sorting domain-containing protein [Verrucomicrobiales bacterium]|nr:PEP-CTERM sorting domain-containing protein [Verrucomicrobiales bacterium]
MYNALWKSFGLVTGIWTLSQTAASAALVLSADFNANNGGFTVANAGTPAGPWTWDGVGTWLANGEGNLGTPTASELTSPAFNVPAAGPLTVAISHRYSFEFDGTRWDGGRLQYSQNGGAWTNVSAAFTSGGYDGVITGNNALNGSQGWNGDSAGYGTGSFITSQVSIPGFAAGDSVQIRFQAGWDEFSTGTAPNWQITNVNVDAVPEPATTGMLAAAAAGILCVRRRRR